MTITIKTKIIAGICVTGIAFIAGTRFSQKPEIKIQYVDKIHYVEKKEEQNKEKKQKSSDKKSKGRIVVVTHKTKLKDGKTETTTTKTIDFNNQTKSNSEKIEDKKSKDSIHKDESVKEKVTQSYSNYGIDYTFMVGRSFSNSQLDYIGTVGVPIPFFSKLKANAGFEWQDKKIFVGGTFNF